MPRGNGTGPRGQGPGTGRGLGRRAGNPQGGMGIGTPRGMRRGGGKSIVGGFGPGGYCVCPSCRTKVSHQAGSPCNEMSCPKCGAKMTRG
ncbi:MAG: DUF5320 family protein [bacterium]|nr:DUF5320 family protein [bacterium]